MMIAPDRPQLGRLRELVVPAPVVEAPLALEERGVALGVVVHEQQHLAAQVRALVVVPAVLGRDDPVADEDDLGVADARLRRLDAGEGDVVRRRAAASRCRCRPVTRTSSGQDAVTPTISTGWYQEPPGPAGSRPIASKRDGHVLAGERVAARAGSASLEQVAREEADVGADPMLPDRVCRLLLVRRDHGGLDRREPHRRERRHATGQQQPHRVASLRCRFVRLRCADWILPGRISS